MKQKALEVVTTLGLSTDNQTVHELEIAVGIVSRSPAISAEELHRLFVAQALTEGFVPVPDAEDPCCPADEQYGRPVRRSLLPWEDLPVEKREKAVSVWMCIRSVLGMAQHV